jgi:hypothetical protein
MWRGSLNTSTMIVPGLSDFLTRVLRISILDVFSPAVSAACGAWKDSYVLSTVMPSLCVL